VVWIDDAPPAGSAPYNVTRDTLHHATGAKSLTRLSRESDNVMGFQHATAHLDVGANDNLIFYARTNECARPARIVATWITTDGVTYQALWGEPLAGVTRIGALPTSTEWTRLEVPASVLGMEGKAVHQFFIQSCGGQSWIDHVGNAPQSPVGATVADPFIHERPASASNDRDAHLPQAATSPVPAQSTASEVPDTRRVPTTEANESGWRDRFPLLFGARVPVSLGVTAKYVEANSSSPLKRHSLYSPELQLLAESDVAAAATPAVKYEYVWFAGQPLAQIETSTGAIDYYFNGPPRHADCSD
jgi:hypothetical protein